MAALGPRDTPTIASVAARPEAWGWALAGGTLLTAAGVVALCVPGRTTVALSLALAWVLVVAGIAGLVMGFRTAVWQRRLADWLFGLASLIVGGSILAYRAPAPTR